MNTAEFFVAVAISAAFLWTIATGRFNLGAGTEWANAVAAISGLILGGLVAAPLAGYVTKIAPARFLLGAAAFLVIALSIFQGVQLWPHLLDEPIVQRFNDALAPR